MVPGAHSGESMLRVGPKMDEATKLLRQTVALDMFGVQDCLETSISIAVLYKLSFHLYPCVVGELAILCCC